jgi:hypothetical protein
MVFGLQFKSDGGQRRLFYDQKSHYALDYEKHKISVQFFPLKTAFLCSPLLDDFFLVSRLIYTRTRKQAERQFFYDHGMNFGSYFWCVFM